MKLFGEGGLIDFSTTTVDQYSRYNELAETTWAFEDNPTSPTEGPEFDQWREKMEEQTDLYYALDEKGCFVRDDEPEPSSGGFWSRLFG